MTARPQSNIPIPAKAYEEHVIEVVDQTKFMEMGWDSGQGARPIRGAILSLQTKGSDVSIQFLHGLTNMSAVPTHCYNGVSMKSFDNDPECRHVVCIVSTLSS